MDLYETYLTHYAATLGTAHGVQREPFLRMESIEVGVRAACKVEEARSGDSR